MRVIEVYSTEFGDTTREVTVSDNCTLSELKRALGLTGDNWTCIGRQTKSTYIFDNAEINSRDVLVAVYPKKMKAGLSSSEKDELNSLYEDIVNTKDKARSIISAILDITEENLDENAGETPVRKKSSKRKDPGFDSMESELGL
jgi:hypothetical protein